MSNETFVDIDVGYRGTVTGLSRSARYQRATFTIKDARGRVFACSTLLGAGENISMKQEVNNFPVWDFGPFDRPMTISIFIENSSSNDDDFVPSKVVQPITVRKEPDAEIPQTYIVSTLLSEDSEDHDFNDAIISIFQYEGPNPANPTEENPSPTGESSTSAPPPLIKEPPKVVQVVSAAGGPRGIYYVVDLIRYLFSFVIER